MTLRRTKILVPTTTHRPSLARIFNPHHAPAAGRHPYRDGDDCVTFRSRTKSQGQNTNGYHPPLPSVETEDSSRPLTYLEQVWRGVVRRREDLFSPSGQTPQRGIREPPKIGPGPPKFSYTRKGTPTLTSPTHGRPSETRTSQPEGGRVPRSQLRDEGPSLGLRDH